MLLEILTIITNTSVLSIVGYVIFNYLKIKREILRLKMDAEEILKESDQNIKSDQNNEHNETKRERLSAIVAGGGSKQYLGKDLQSQTLIQ